MRPLIPRPLLVVLAALLACACWPGSALAADGPGRVRFAKEASSDFDAYTQAPSADRAAWMRDHYFRQKAYSSYFDSRTSWYPSAWFYKDFYAIYRDSSVVAAHPEWVLKDSAGQRLYIPWGCSGGTCPQYAADITNSSFRATWIAEARATLARGYRGIYIDDVNLEFRVGNGNGSFVAPIDSNTGQPMTAQAWRRYVADFTEQIRRELPGTEIVHNAIWFSGHADPDVQRELLSADAIDIERGVSDDGLTNGGGRYGFETLLAHVDWLHAHGKNVLYDAYTNTRQGADYNLATYYLAGNGHDLLRTDYKTLPDDWWTGYDADLGAPLNDRYSWHGLLRRDFQNGYALVNQPGNTTQTITNPQGATNPDNTPAPQTTLQQKQGATILTRHARTLLAVKAVPNPPRTGHSVKAREARRRHPRLAKAVLVKAHVRRAKGGKLRLVLQRRVRGHWKRVRAQTVRVKRNGVASRVFRRLRRGRYRVAATYVPPLKSRRVHTVRRFRLRR